MFYNLLLPSQKKHLFLYVFVKRRAYFKKFFYPIKKLNASINKIILKTKLLCFRIGGLKKTDIIERALIDAAVPFLPLEKKHVMLCIQAEIDKHNLVDQEEESRPMKDYTEDDLSALAELRSYDKEGVFR